MEKRENSPIVKFWNDFKSLKESMRKIDQIKICECWKDEFIKVDNTYFFECQLWEFFSRSSYLSKAISSKWVLLCFSPLHLYDKVDIENTYTGF